MAQRNRVTTGNTVTVACKLPNGLIMRVFNMVDHAEPVMGGGSRTAKVAAELPGKYFIHGNSHPQNHAPQCQIADGFALTPGIPEEFWDKWLSQNKDSDMVKNGLIFAHTQQGSVLDHAEDNKDIKSGLERLDPNKLPKGVTKSDIVVRATV